MQLLDLLLRDLLVSPLSYVRSMQDCCLTVSSMPSPSNLKQNLILGKVATLGPLSLTFMKQPTSLLSRISGLGRKLRGALASSRVGGSGGILPWKIFEFYIARDAI